MTTTDSENFYRVVSLLLDAGTEVLRRLFVKYALSSGATSVYNYLSNEQAKIFKLQKSKYLKSHQISLLLGRSSASGIDINDWDINLLCVLLKHISPVSQQEEAAIENLRLLRNTVYGHAGDAKLSQTDFTTYWQKIEGELLLLSQSCGDPAFDKTIKDDISKTKTCPLNIESTVEALKQWYSQNQQATEKLEDIDYKLEELLTEVKGISVNQKKSENPVLKKLKEHSKVVLDEINLDHFVETTQTRQARVFLEKENAVFIHGAAGEGKTTCALVLATQLDRDKLLIINNASQIEHVDPNEVVVIVIDDIFGHYCFDQEKFNGWKAYLEILQSLVKNNGIKTILTLRTDIWHDCQTEMVRFEVFSHLVQLSSLHISSDEKRQILSMHLQLTGRKLQSDKIEELVGEFSLPFGFPACANKFAVKTDVYVLQEEFFHLPYFFIREMLVTVEKELYASLLFLFYKKDNCIDACLKPQRRIRMDGTNSNVTLLNDIAKLVGINPSNISLPLVHDNLERLCGILVTHKDKRYSFINNAVYNCITVYYGEQYPEEVVENCDIEFLCQHVQVAETTTGSKVAVVIESDSYEILAERLIEEVIVNHRSEKIISSDAYQSKSFVKFLADTLLESQRIIPFLSNGKAVAETDGSTFKTGFLKTFIESKPDQLCANVTTQLLHAASKTEETVWYNKLKTDIEETLCEKGYHSTLKSINP